jgi:renalase
MKKITIIGAGFSAAVLSTLLSEHELSIFDKGRGPGGRSSARRVDGVGVFDHGLQYVHPKKSQFQFFLDQHLSNHIHNWQGSFYENGNQVKKDKVRYVGNSGNNDFVKHLLAKNTSYQKELTSLKQNNSGWNLSFKDGSETSADNVILTIPLEQCRALLQPLNLAIKLEGGMQPIFSVMLALNKSSGIQGSGYVISNNPTIGWCANESSKDRENNNSNLELWSIQSTIEYAKHNYKHYREKKEAILQDMVKAFVDQFGLQQLDINYQNIHGWLYAYNEQPKTEKYIWLPEIGLGICGDWMAGPKAENSWESASLLAKAITEDGT